MAKDQINLKKINRIEYKDIIKDNNPLIREISHDVPFPLTKEDRLLMNQMIDYVRSSQDPKEAAARNLRPAYGISAIQVGQPKKLIYIRIENEYGSAPEEFALVNPYIVYESPMKSFLSSGEGCLSVDNDHKGFVVRNHQIKIRAIDYFTDREIEIDAKSLTAIVLQHEMDHLLGILFYDRINKLNPYNANKDWVKIEL